MAKDKPGATNPDDEKSGHGIGNFFMDGLVKIGLAEKTEEDLGQSTDAAMEENKPISQKPSKAKSAVTDKMPKAFRPHDSTSSTDKEGQTEDGAETARTNAEKFTTNQETPVVAPGGKSIEEMQAGIMAFVNDNISSNDQSKAQEYLLFLSTLADLKDDIPDINKRIKRAISICIKTGAVKDPVELRSSAAAYLEVLEGSEDAFNDSKKEDEDAIASLKESKNTKKRRAKEVAEQIKELQKEAEGLSQEITELDRDVSIKTDALNQSKASFATALNGLLGQTHEVIIKVNEN